MTQETEKLAADDIECRCWTCRSRCWVEISHTSNSHPGALYRCIGCKAIYPDFALRTPPADTADELARETVEAAINQNIAMRLELANVGNLVSDLARVMGVDQANDDGSWPDLAGRVQKLTQASRLTTKPDAEQVREAAATFNGKPRGTEPAACCVLAGRFDDSVGEWVFGVVLTPLSQPFTHWWPLPDLAAAPPKPDPTPPADDVLREAFAFFDDFFSEPSNAQRQWCRIRAALQAGSGDAVRQALREARIDMDLARNRLIACTVSAIAWGKHREQAEWGDWNKDAAAAVARIDAALSGDAGGSGA